MSRMGDANSVAPEANGVKTRITNCVWGVISPCWPTFTLPAVVSACCSPKASCSRWHASGSQARHRKPQKSRSPRVPVTTSELARRLSVRIPSTFINVPAPPRRSTIPSACRSRRARGAVGRETENLVESSEAIHYKKACVHPRTTKAAAPRRLSNL
jgi:hypothetical protein